MYHLKMSTTAVEIDAECDWDEKPWGEGGFNSTDHPERYAIFSEFEKDSIKLLHAEVFPDSKHNVEWFAKKWKIIKFNKFGKYHCSTGYSDYLNPDKSYAGRNPEILKWIKEMYDVS